MLKRFIFAFRQKFFSLALILIVLVLLHYVTFENIKTDSLTFFTKERDNFIDKMNSASQNSAEPLQLKSNPDFRIFCFVPTYGRNLETRAVAVRDTWSRRCDRMIFAADEDNLTFPTMKLGYPGRKYLWAKVRDTFEYLHDNHLENYQWFYKGDDNTYVIVENLRHFLAQYDPEKPWFFGHRFKAFLKEGYASGGPGYVLSRGALRKLGPALKNITPGHRCAPGNQSGQARGEDFRMGECLKSLGIAPSSTLDKKGRERFHVFYPESSIAGPQGVDWYHGFNFHPHQKGFDCCSERTISFHYVSGVQMYGIEFLIYHIKPVVFSTFD